MDGLGDAEAEGVCGPAYPGDHGRLGSYLGGQRLRDWGGDRVEEVVVMRKLNLSERRDSFKKQEAVQEVSFDEPEEKAACSPTPAPAPAPATPPVLRPPCKAPWIVAGPQTSEESGVKRSTLVPQIAVLGSESEEPSETEEDNEQPDPTATRMSEVCAFPKKSSDTKGEATACMQRGSVQWAAIDQPKGTTDSPKASGPQRKLNE